ncbi:MAG: hypothetical protein OXC26_20765 [Albidovulum sp.]|nr:hypothetical protein [Albidovulum sp.]
MALVLAVGKRAINNDALVNAVNTGRLKRAGLDTFASEPPGASSAAGCCSGIVISPHIGGVIRESALRMPMRCAENVVLFLMQGTCGGDFAKHSRDARC